MKEEKEEKKECLRAKKSQAFRANQYTLNSSAE